MIEKDGEWERDPAGGGLCWIVAGRHYMIGFNAAEALYWRVSIPIIDISQQPKNYSRSPNQIATKNWISSLLSTIFDERTHILKECNNKTMLLGTRVNFIHNLTNEVVYFIETAHEVRKSKSVNTEKFGLQFQERVDFPRETWSRSSRKFSSPNISVWQFVPDIEFPRNICKSQ